MLQLVAVAVGGAATLGGTWWATTQQLEAASNDAQRVVRADTYEAFIDAANLYGVYAQLRFEACQPGTDLPRDPAVACAPVQDIYQSARFGFAGARFDLQLYGSARAIDLADLLATLLPPTDVGFTGDPVDADAPIGDTVDLAMVMFRQVQRCEVAVVVPADCSEEIEAIDVLLELFGYDVDRY